MPTWSDFEVQCTDYLEDRFGGYARFIHQGGSDSTVPDILVRPVNGGEPFYIEVKHSPAQCGQFVLTPDITAREFVYSGNNANPLNEWSGMIMKYMNKDFDAFRDAGTRGKTIDMPDGPKIFSNWIIQAYEHKGARFFITNGFTMVPLHEFGECFDVSATYRIKRSGSSAVGWHRMEIVERYIHDHGYDDGGSRNDDRGKLYVYPSKRVHHGQRFVVDNDEYMFSSRDGRYEVRRLSNTYNANVIFSIVMKPFVSGLTDSEFIACLG